MDNSVLILIDARYSTNKKIVPFLFYFSIFILILCCSVSKPGFLAPFLDIPFPQHSASTPCLFQVPYRSNLRRQNINIMSVRPSG